MDDKVKQLKGSKLRDDWRWQRKQKMPRQAYGIDGDFLVVEFKKGIVACLDVKAEKNSVTDTEHEAYQHLIKLGIPVFIILIIDVEQGLMNIYEYPSEELLAFCNDWKEYTTWENKLRR